MSLARHHLGYSTLTDTIYLARFGSKPGVAVEKREIENEVYAVVIEQMMEGTPNGASKVVRFGDEAWEVTVKPVAHQGSDAPQEER